MNWHKITITMIVIALISGAAWALGSRLLNESLDPIFGPRNGTE